MLTHNRYCLGCVSRACIEWTVRSLASGHLERQGPVGSNPLPRERGRLRGLTRRDLAPAVPPKTNRMTAKKTPSRSPARGGVGRPRIRRRTLLFIALALVVVALLGTIASLGRSVPSLEEEPNRADLIVLGQIITVDELRPRAEAVAVRDGRIHVVGSREEVLAYKGTATRVVELGDAVLLPGLIDAHSHPIMSAMMSQTLDISGFHHSTRAEVMEVIDRGVAQAGGGEWVIAYGWDPALVPDLSPPTLAELDAIAPNNPLLIIAQTLHSAHANSAAFSAAGITRDSPDPAGGYFERDEDG